MAKAKRKSTAKAARKGRKKSKSRPAARRRPVAKPKSAERKSASQRKAKPARGITRSIGNAVQAVVDTIKETTALRRKMPATQTEE